MSATVSDNDALAAQAAQWIVALSADDGIERERARTQFEAWKRADPRHAAAAAGMERLLGQVSDIRSTGTSGAGNAAVAAVLAMHGKRRRIKTHVAAMALACMLAVPAWLAFQAYPPSYLMADVRAGTGQWKTQTLADGTRITLNSASAVNLRYDAARRAIELLQGEILVDVAKDPARPFLIETGDGAMRALGTRFVVSRHENSTVLQVLESKVSVQTADQRRARSTESTLIEAGQAVRIRPDGLDPIDSIDPRSVEDAWAQHRLFVDDRPLSEVLDALNRHRSGHIQYDASAIGHLRISAVLPLDDTDRALQLLAANLPGLRIRTYTPYLVRVDLPAAP
ncbi:FecR domain-containing protein [Achromobacter mucicolens]|uniref:FecR family protein n=1 Tax=Achromobacter mucicolens TaxID=1389922 RepID=UPI002448A53A|nr:FecR domain-containing protein [Achromobacter mucicolens]MDH0090145.1 FecR domain-containing protein [Achromobacter mucicolens]